MHNTPHRLRFFKWRVSPNTHVADRCARFWLALAAFALLATFGDYGMTWDEGKHIVYGNHIFAFFTSFGSERGALTYSLDYLYGGGYDLLGAIFRRATRAFIHEREAMHLLGAMIGWISLVGTWRLGRKVYGPWPGFLALVLLSLTPVYVGQITNNPKDLPFAAGYVWALLACQRFLRALPYVPPAVVATTALALGMATCVRIAGLMVPALLVAFVALDAIHRAWQLPTWEVRYRQASTQMRQALLAVAGGWLVMISSWPWALFDPVARPLVALTRMSAFASHRRMMPFAGEMVSTLDVPRDYLLHYFGLMLPEMILLGLVLGLLQTMRRHERFTDGLGQFLLVVAVLFPPAYAIYKHSPLYDGLRHFLFLIPPICVLAAGGIHGALLRLVALRDLLQRRLPPSLIWLRQVPLSVALAALAFGLADALHTIIVVHPHQYVWFNRFSGGLAQAVHNYDTDYYGNSYRQLLEELPQRLWEREPETYLNHIYTARGCIARSWVTHYTPPNFQGEPGRGKPADFHVGYTRDRCLTKRDRYPMLHEVVVQGATISAVFDVRPGAARKASPLAPPTSQPSDKTDETVEMTD